MRLERYDPRVAEPRQTERWEEAGVYAFQPGDAKRPVYSIDTPPPTVSGFLHLGNVYSYSHADFMARFWRMNGYNVYYPMGYDDNGLPTERLVERLIGATAEEIGREAFIRACLETSREYEGRYEALFRRLGLSIDWRYTYRTIDDLARKTSQASFLGLLRDGHAYRRQAPTIWCPTCHTAIAQAEEKDVDRDSEIVTIAFRREDGSTLPIATTRPELLPACVAVFVHPEDERYRDLAGQTVRVPIFDLTVPVLQDAHADPAKGTGAVMCCTFGDTIDVEWWYTHELPLREAIDRHGRMTPLAGPFADLTVEEARRATIAALEAEGLLLNRQSTRHSVRAHERCDTPVEYVVTPQWFVRVLDRKAELLAAGDAVTWHPDHMRVRYREWVEGLHWDWCISRQRYYGVPFPVWLCDACGEVMPADESQLPVDPTTTPPPRPCECGSDSLRPEEDVMDTWATSAVSPQIAGRQRSDPALYEEVFPMALRPQAHEIIRTWAFDTIVMSLYLYGTLPWRDVFISGWGVAPGGAEKISKSRGGGPMTPMETLDRYGADAVRYWAGSTGTGKDAVISEEKMAAGAKLVTKLWSVASFSARFLEGFEEPATLPSLSPADRWIVSRAERLKGLATAAFRDYEYAVAKNETEGFFWRDLCDNYLEMAKKRLYDGTEAERTAACFALSHSFYTVLVLLAPIMPFVTEEIYGALFRRPGAVFLHGTRWPEVREELIDTDAEAAGEALVAIATAVRRYKSERNLSLGAPLAELRLTVRDGWLGDALYGGEVDIASITRAQTVTGGDGAGPDGLETVLDDPQLGLLVQVGGAAS